MISLAVVRGSRMNGEAESLDEMTVSAAVWPTVIIIMPKQRYG